MSTLIEDPDIPLVGLNNHFQKYTEERIISVQEDEERSSDIRKFSMATINGKYYNVGCRLARRKLILRERRIVSDLSLCFAVLGVVIMALNIELCINLVYDSHDLTSQLVKLCISASTFVLLVLIVWYHVMDIRLFMCDNSVEDWRLAVSPGRISCICLELVICVIHPFPWFRALSSGTVNAVSTTTTTTTTTVSPDYSSPTKGGEITVQADMDVYLSIPMLMRVFLVGRCILLHSRLYTDASSQSLGALNRVHFNATFIFRSLMKLYPEYLLTTIMLSVFLTASWTLHACEAQLGMSNSMWLIAITFLTVGYGDLVPHSYCGRGVAVMAGMFGAGCTALVVAVLAHKLELTRGEKFVHNFVLEVELDKRYKIAAANIVKAGWQVYKYKSRGGRSGRVRHYQRKLLRAIHEIREVKQEQRRVVESGVSIVEIYKSHNSVCSAVHKLGIQQAEMTLEVSSVKDKLERIENRLERIFDCMANKSVSDG